MVNSNIGVAANTIRHKSEYEWIFKKFNSILIMEHFFISSIGAQVQQVQSQPVQQQVTPPPNVQPNMGNFLFNTKMFV